MNSLISFLLMAPSGGGGAASGGAGSMIPTLIFFAAMILVLYFLMIRPQQKRQKEHQKMLSSLKVGDKVITTAGIHGKIEKLDEKTITLKIDNTKITFERSAIVSKIDS